MMGLDVRLILAVAVGGSLGSVARFVVGTTIQERSGGVFPVGTLIVNISGSLLLGFLLEYALATPAISREARVLLTTGFVGGYTTFSTFSYETARLLQAGDYRRAGLYAFLSFFVSVAATFVGFVAARQLLALQRTL